MLLITGGAGLIGSLLVREFNKMGRSDIIVVDRLRQESKWLNLRGAKYEKFIHADEFFPYVHKDISAIFHIGACSATTEKDVDYLQKNNVEYSQKLFDLACQLDIPFIYASSAATYGMGQNGFDDSHEVVDRLLPLNPYGWSKNRFDQWVLSRLRFPKTWFGLKFFNVYGPNEYHKGPMRSVVVQAFEQIKNDKKVKLFRSYNSKYKDGGQMRDFVYGKDIVKAMVKLLNIEDNQKSGLYNMGTGKARTFEELAKATFAALDIQPQIEYIEMPEHLKKQYQYYTQANMQKFKTLMPKFTWSSLEDGIKDYVQNYLNSENPYY